MYFKLKRFLLILFLALANCQTNSSNTNIQYYLQDIHGIGASEKAKYYLLIDSRSCSSCLNLGNLEEFSSQVSIVFVGTEGEFNSYSDLLFTNQVEEVYFDSLFLFNEYNLDIGEPRLIKIAPTGITIKLL